MRPWGNMRFKCPLGAGPKPKNDSLEAHAIYVPARDRDKIKYGLGAHAIYVPTSGWGNTLQNNRVTSYFVKLINTVKIESLQSLITDVMYTLTYWLMSVFEAL